ncbi:ABC transporter ATP-binding protein [Rickettsiales endosymbiont of Stachyamoeba lipophora]|uniref:ABC transporter ATP-binding protein n=1 Tax=Rickettsiales endosymbiont of Stachyamoeba lipophora TaxID=2486578 RepID=UPI000F647A87|nr:ABC transporter transmembrane domain-containing protein [Rickettsiales endosymbiont of Stachyamoeba lipophora]AZL15426.1 ATP-binding cassette domain-containing protein [Rickettsiales endosymbiont of Stachyamoeba lipophora]
MKNSIFYTLWLYLKPYKSKLVGVLIALAFTSFSVLGIGRGVGYLIDQGLNKNDIALFDEALLILLCFAFALAIATFFRSMLMNVTCEKVAADIRKDVFDKIIYYPLEYFEKQSVADITSRLTNDITLVNSMIVNLLSTAIRNSILCVGGVILMVTTSYKLSLCVILTIPFIVIPIIFFAKNVKSVSQDYLAKTASIGVDLQEKLGAIHLIKVFAYETEQIANFHNVIHNVFLSAKIRVYERSKFAAIVIALVLSAVSFISWVGGKGVLNGSIMPGQLSSFIFYAIIVAASVGALAEMWSEFSKAKAALVRVFELLNFDKEARITAPVFMHDFSINFDKVSFSYPSNLDKKVLNNFSLNINEGEKIAIVGYSGSGKTTIFSLLLNLYNNYDGKINIGGIDAKLVPLKDLRSVFSIVPQETQIFSTSIINNIKFANPQASEEEVVKAAEMAEIHHFIMSLPDDYSTFVGERGMRLSGGQKQRIAIARAFLRNAPILLLDEATSSLDVEHEFHIQKAINKLMQDKTTIIISHRLSTIIKADKIIVLDQGEMVSQGTHQELLSKCDIYQKLYNLTFEK